MGPVSLVGSAGDLEEALQQTRLASGMTQEELSEATGVDRTYLARMDSGLSVLLLERLMRLLRYPGTEVTVTLPDLAARGAVRERECEWAQVGSEPVRPSL